MFDSTQFDLTPDRHSIPNSSGRSTALFYGLAATRRGKPESNYLWPGHAFDGNLFMNRLGHEVTDTSSKALIARRFG